MQRQVFLDFKTCFKDKSVLIINRQVVNLLKTLPDYTEGEEKLLICKSLDLTLQSLMLLKEFNSLQLKILKNVVKKRLEGIPLNKILKRADFYLDEFYINHKVLAPRKETEVLVEKVLQIIDDNNKKQDNSQVLQENNNRSRIKVLDLCCGSGAIGLSIAKHCKNNVFVTLLDKSLSAIRVSQKNANRLQVKNNTKIIKSDMFRHLKKGEKFDIIASNPPYIATNKLDDLQEGVKKYDPQIALDGGEDGLKFYKIIASGSKEFLKQNGFVAVEIGFDQGEQVKKLFEKNAFEAKVFKDYSGNDRIIVAHL